MALWQQLRLVRPGSSCGLISRGKSNTSRRDFYQRIDEQFLAKELENLSLVAKGEPPDPRIFEPRDRNTRRATRQFAGSTAESFDDRSLDASPSSSQAQGFPNSNRRKPWMHYESLRGSTYPGGSSGDKPRFRDLTHSEVQRLQEMAMRKRMLDRKLLWLKMSQLPNPQKEAKFEMRRREQEDEAAKEGQDMYPIPFLDHPPNSNWLVRMADDAKRDELESRFRMRIRQEKLLNSKVMKEAVPDMAGAIVDPIKRHIYRRLVRQRVKMQTGLEEILTSNTAQILHEFMKGVAISVVRIRSKRPRQCQEIYYSLSSNHDPEWVKTQLDVLAPKLRSQLALKVNMGRTPNIKFVPQAESEDSKRKNLWRFARRVQRQIPPGGGYGKSVGVG